MNATANRRRGSALRLVGALIGSCHPLPTVAVSTMTVLLGAGVGLPPGRVVLLGVAVFTGQLSIGWSNDAIDASRDRVTGRHDKPVATGGVPLELVWVAASSSLIATTVLSSLLGPYPAAGALLLVAAGWLYNLGLKSTPLSGVAYLVGFGSLAATPYLAGPGHRWPPWWVPCAGALLGVGAHFANALPDLRADRETGVRGLPLRLGRRNGVIVMATVLASASVVLAVGARGSAALSIAGAMAIGGGGVLAAILAAATAIRVPEGAASFRITLVIALLDVVVLITTAKDAR